MDALPSQADVECPSCRRRGLRRFYDQPSAPIDSCGLAASRAEALAAPRRPLRLGFCAGCGLMTSRAVDAALADPSASYRETQIHSPRFR